jgi:hypothetical protein
VKEKEVAIERYFEVVTREGLYGSKENLRFYLNRIFSELEFDSKMMLDIGGGAGLLSFYGACMGAREVICLEPEDDGGDSTDYEKFTRVNSALRLAQVRRERTRFQCLQKTSEKFDIVVSHNSINHLEPQACMNMLNDKDAKDTYRDICFKINSLCNTGAKLVVCDCSRYNFFPFIGLKNPFDPFIDWDKHQSPEVWAALFEEAGFGRRQISWSSFNTFRSPGKLFLGNKVASFFITSNFCLKMEKL